MVDWLLGAWGIVKTWAQSEQVIASLAGALAGAWFGAWAARSGAARDKERDSLLSEVRAVNAAGSLSFSICNIVLGLKTQHVKGMKERHVKTLADLLEHKRKLEAGELPPGTVFGFVMDLQTLPLMQLPTGELRRLAFDRLSLPSRAMAAVIQLHQVAAQLDVALARRNEFIERTKTRKAAGHTPMTPQEYFGLPGADGHVNMDFPDTLKAIYTQTDDVIFYSWLLGNDLAEHGEQASKTFRRRFGTKSLPRIRTADYSKAKAEGLMPDEKEYANWLGGFQPAPDESLMGKARAALKKILKQN